jgi:3-phosphoshikimate 1-carboxyvinyltransferase
LSEPDDVLDMGNSGTAARLLSGILASHGIASVMTGDASLRRRPMKRVTDPLAATGATFISREGGRLPLAHTGADQPARAGLSPAGGFGTGQIRRAAGGLNATGTTRVEEPVPTRDHTENMLRYFGATVEVESTPEGGRINPAGRPT